MPNNEQHEQWMQRALELARQGTGLTSPNPQVGAVIVSDDGKVLGEGSHRYAEVKHAEVLAIEQTRENAPDKRSGATMYITLEPCSHTGRTEPCTDVVVESGVRRVVAAMRDPNPRVSGKGFERLRAAGIEVIEGVLHGEARKINEWFAKYILTGTPFVTLKAGMTLDGKIAPPPGVAGESPTALGAGNATRGWITSGEARAHVQELRHASDAILAGIGTVIADDPLLTDRTGRPRRRPLLRVIVDSQLRMPLGSRIVTTAQDDVLVFCAHGDEKKREHLEERGVRVEQLPDAGQSGDNGKPDLRLVVKRLGEMQIASLLIEGGAAINWSALHAGIVDKVFLYYAPKILAGAHSVPFAAGTGFGGMNHAAHLKDITLHRFGEDFAVEGYLHDPYSSPPEMP